MSGKSKSNKKNNKKIRTKKSFNKLKIIIPIAAVFVIGIIIVIAAVAAQNPDTAKIKNELCKTKWTPVSATDASGDEVEMAQIYNTYYSSYKGSLEYFDNDTFSFWMSPGVSSDGTHSGRYEVADGQTVNMYFDDGTNTKFSIKSEDNKIISIEVNYDEYQIIFTADESGAVA